jgi:molybdate transport system permease protein
MGFTGISILFVLVTVSSLFIKTSPTTISTLFIKEGATGVISLTLFSLLVSSGLVIITGVPFAYLLTTYQNRFTRLILLLMKIPLIMPPMITGLALLMTFGREGILKYILALFSLNIPFSFTAIVLVQYFIIFPIFTQSLVTGFKAIDVSVKEAALLCGVNQWKMIITIFLPISKQPFISGLTMGLFRGAGEFGATLIFAGNLNGKTRTITTAIYTFAQQDIGLAIAFSVILISTLAIPLIILELVRKEE